jgi:glycosyltransferase involved in cell wall biosynthesis
MFMSGPAACTDASACLPKESTAPPLVSVVLPTHNGQRYLEQSIDSIVSQTYAHWELILVDDGSADATPEICRRAAERDTRIRYIRLEPNRGLPGALNEGFRQACGQYWTWTSDDNRYLPPALERMAGFLAQHPQTALVYAGMQFIDAQGAAVGIYEPEAPELLTVRPVVQGCFLYRSDVARRVGEYDDAHRLCEDYDFWLRVAALGRLSRIPDLLYEYRRHSGSLTSTRGLQIIEAKAEVLSRHLPGLAAFPSRSRAEGWLEVARHWCFLGNMPRVRSALLRAVREGGISVLPGAKRPLIAALIGRNRMYRLVGAKHLLDPHSEVLRGLDWWDLV